MNWFTRFESAILVCLIFVGIGGCGEAPTVQEKTPEDLKKELGGMSSDDYSKKMQSSAPVSE